MVILYVVWWLASTEVLWGVGIISSQVFGHLGSFKGWIQTEACVIPSYHPVAEYYFFSYRILFVRKENKNNNFIQQFLLFCVISASHSQEYHYSLFKFWTKQVT